MKCTHHFFSNGKAIASLLIFFLVFFSCKSSKNDASIPTSNYEIILLFEDEDAIPDDLQSLKAVEIKSSKRSSRSQNQWMILIDNVTEKEINDLIENLRKEENVTSATKVEKGQETINSSNSNKSNSKPNN